MGNSKDPIIGRNPWVAMPRTRGSLGMNGDAGDPNTPDWFVGDTPSSLGIRDHADPNSLMFRQRLPFGPDSGRSAIWTEALECREKPIPGYLQKYLAPLRDPTETWVAQQKLSKPEIQDLVHEMERRLDMFAKEEAALLDEIEKVQKDLEAYAKVQQWFKVESLAREVLTTETQSKFNDLRWGGRGVKVGGININAGGEPAISEEFRKANPEVIVQGYVLHEQVHQKHLKEMSVYQAFFKSIGNPLKHGTLLPQTWAAGQKIESELEAHRVQKQFYENFLSGLRGERARSERLLKALRVRY